MNLGVNLEYQARNFILSAVTGYQNLNDRMFLDQDFTERAVYTLEQKQKSNTVSEEIVFKSKSNKRWQWATGAFGLYQSLNTKGPVTFGEDRGERCYRRKCKYSLCRYACKRPEITFSNQQSYSVGRRRL